MSQGVYEIPTSRSLEGGGGGNAVNNVSPATAAAAASGGLLGLGLRSPSALSCVHPSNVILYHPIYRLNIIESIKEAKFT
ncbi:hypothetical protein ACTXT7_003845 [Hymenolepis weldensis]